MFWPRGYGLALPLGDHDNESGYTGDVDCGDGDGWWSVLWGCWVTVDPHGMQLCLHIAIRQLHETVQYYWKASNFYNDRAHNLWLWIKTSRVPLQRGAEQGHLENAGGGEYALRCIAMHCQWDNGDACQKVDRTPGFPVSCSADWTCWMAFWHALVLYNLRIENCTYMYKRPTSTSLNTLLDINI